MDVEVILNDPIKLWAECLPSGIFNNDKSSLKYSLNYLINFNTASVFVA